MPYFNLLKKIFALFFICSITYLTYELILNDIRFFSDGFIKKIESSSARSSSLKQDPRQKNDDHQEVKKIGREERKESSEKMLKQVNKYLEPKSNYKSNQEEAEKTITRSEEELIEMINNQIEKKFKESGDHNHEKNIGKNIDNLKDIVLKNNSTTIREQNITFQNTISKLEEKLEKNEKIIEQQRDLENNLQKKSQEQNLLILYQKLLINFLTLSKKFENDISYNSELTEIYSILTNILNQNKNQYKIDYSYHFDKIGDFYKNFSNYKIFITSSLGFNKKNNNKQNDIKEIEVPFLRGFIKIDKKTPDYYKKISLKEELGILLDEFYNYITSDKELLFLFKLGKK